MKNLFKNLFCFALLVSLISCGSEETETTLEGTWTAVEFSASISLTTSDGETGTIEIESTDLNYDLTLDGSSFTTSGSYDVTVTASLTGVGTETIDQSYTDVMGSGTYTSTDTDITIDGSFFELELDGMPFMITGEAQSGPYEINSDGELIFEQDETISETEVTGSVRSFSKWVKK